MLNDGFMEGSALLDPLLNNRQRVRHSVPYFEGVHDHFLDRKTGDVQIEDPRHGPLPTGWRIACYKRAGDKVVSNADSGKLPGT